MSKKLVEIASEIVNTQASQSNMSAEEISSALREVFRTLHELNRAESGEVDLSKALEVEPAKALKPVDSIKNDKIICLECGAEMKQLTKFHLVTHSLTAKEYKKKYGFTMSTALTARSLTKARSKAAKKRGVPENLKKYMEARKQAKAEAAAPTIAQTVPASEPKRTKIRKKTAV